MERRAHGQNIYRVSANILRVHEAPTFPGGFIASLSIPWGFSKGDDDMGGYHLVWPRDLCETAGALLACGAHSEVRRILRYLRATQEGDGSWRQNYWLDGAPYWGGVQLDECAFPMLLLDMARREGALGPPDLPHSGRWSSARRASSCAPGREPSKTVGRRTPAIRLSRSPWPLRRCSPRRRSPKPATSRRFRLCCATRPTPGTSRSRTGSTSRIRRSRAKPASPAITSGSLPNLPATGGPDVHGLVQVRNHEVGSGAIAADQLISTDAIALVRFGLEGA